MSSIQLITRERHAAKRWSTAPNYLFAAAEAVLPLALAELPQAVLNMPLAFVASGDAYVLSAVLALEPGTNLFVAPDGRWLGNYIPALLRGYPFRIARMPDQSPALCINEDSGLVSDGPQGEPFFDASGAPMKKLGDTLQFLAMSEQSREQAKRAAAALQSHGLIVPWPLQLKSAQAEQRVEGLFKVDEAALLALPGEALKELAEAGALPLAYAQLLSMQNIGLLGKLVEARNKLMAAMAAPAPTAAELLAQNGGTLNFGSLR